MGCRNKDTHSSVKLLVFAGRDLRKRYKFITDVAKVTDGICSDLIIVQMPLSHFIIQVVQQIKKGRPDLILSIGGGVAGLLGFIAAKIAKTKFAVRLGGDPVEAMKRSIVKRAFSESFFIHMKRGIVNRIDRFVFRRTFYFIVVSSYLKNRLLKYRVFKKKFIFTLPQYKGLSEQQSQIPFKKDGINILTVTNFRFLEKYEGVAQIFRFLDAYSSRHKINIHYTICGDGQYLDKMAALKPLKNNSHFKVSIKGFQRNIAPFYLGADIFIYSSQFDGLPNVILEALSFGLPVIANDNPIFREIITDDETGCLFKVNDLTSFISKIHRIIMQEEYRVKLINNGFDLLGREYSRQKVGTGLLAHIKEINTICFSKETTSSG